jgi:hypothetical protein
MAAECRHVLPRGTRCKGIALSGKSYCYFHDRLHVYRRDGRREDEEPLALPYIEDANGIQLALMQVLGAIATGRLGPRRGGMMLYGLQIAIQALDRTPAVPSGEMVEIADSDESDLELGLELGMEPDMEPGMEPGSCDTDEPCASCQQASCSNVSCQNKQTTRQVQDRETQTREIQTRETQTREVQDRERQAIEPATPSVIPIGSPQHRRLVQELLAEAKLAATRPRAETPDTRKSAQSQRGWT